MNDAKIIKNLLDHYQNRRYDEAEKLALLLTQEFPKHQFGWKVLGSIFGQTGRKPESVKPIYNTASYRWKNYEKYLSTYKKKLDPWLNEYKYLS